MALMAQATPIHIKHAVTARLACRIGKSAKVNANRMAIGAPQASTKDGSLQVKSPV
jgi:hypothetical protein